jgi:hypothetical protein
MNQQLFSVEKVGQKIWLLLYVNNHPIGENSPNLVTLFTPGDSEQF